jgi:DNA repair protein RecO (recombination protein O)
MERAQGIVVRGTDWSETSRIATLFTREFGKIRVLAKGGRRLKSNYEVALDLLGVCDVVFIRKAHGGLDLLTEARVAERFPALRTDLRKLNAGYYLAELLSDGTQDYDPHPELYDAAIGTLRALGADSPLLSGKGEPVTTLVCRFELVWLRELGYTPRLDACASCGAAGPRPLPNGRVLVGPQAGGVLCPTCRPADRDTRSLSPEAFDGFVGLVNGAGDVTPATRGELRALLGQMVCVTLGRRPKLLTYVDGG